VCVCVCVAWDVKPYLLTYILVNVLRTVPCDKINFIGLL